MSDFIKTTVKEVADNFDNLRVPLSAKQRENLEKIYPYYGAQSIIDYVDNYLFDGEYILVAEDGENLRSQNSNVCNLVNGRFWVNNHAHIIRGKNGNSSKYLCYYLNQLNFGPFVTGSAQPKLTKDNLGAIPLNIHLPVEQKQIAKVLSDLDAKIEVNNKINQELEALAKTIYDYWFVQFDFPDQNGKPYKSSGGKMVYNEELKREIPEGWEVKLLGDFAEIKRGKLITEKTANLSGNVKVVSAGIDYSYLHDEANREKYTITVSGSGANAGFVNFWREPIFANDCSTVIGRNDFETFVILQFLKLRQEYILKQARGSAQPHVYPKDLAALKILIPNSDLFESYGKKVLALNEKISNNDKENQKLAALRDWLLPMLMNGQVTVKSSDEVRDQDKEILNQVQDDNKQVQDDSLGRVAEDKEAYKINR